MVKIMKIINVKILCVVLTAALVLESNAGKIPKQKDLSLDLQVANDENIQAEDIREIGDESGSGVEEEASGAGVSGSGEEEEEEEERRPPVRLPKPMGLPFVGMRGPVTITPIDPGVNRQKPYHRPCLFCFPRGRLGRVEVTAPGGPYLMNGFPLAGFGVGYPNMGMGPPQGGPVYPGNMEFPEYGPGPFAGGPPSPCCSEGTCNCQRNEEQGPMDFQELNEGQAPIHPKAHDGPMIHGGHKAMAGHPSKAMAGHPNKGIPQSIHKPMDLHQKAAAFDKSNKAFGHVSMKGIMDEPANKPLTGKVGNQPSPNKGNDKGIEESKKTKRVEDWVNI